MSTKINSRLMNGGDERQKRQC